MFGSKNVHTSSDKKIWTIVIYFLATNIIYDLSLSKHVFRM